MIGYFCQIRNHVMIKITRQITLSLLLSLTLLSCEKTPVVNKHAPDKEDETEDVLPTPLAKEQFSPSLKKYAYLPIMVKYASSNSRPVVWKEEKTRILPYLLNFTPDTTVAHYISVTNKYGSRTDRPKQEATCTTTVA